MGTAEAVLLVVGIVVLLTLISFVAMYNRFVRQRTLVDESWHGIDVELTRRHDLIPNLVATVQGYAAHERTVLDQLVQAREAATTHQAGTPHELARVEAYPELKASQNFLQLQRELTTTEDRIAAARRFYNGNVRAFNTRVDTFPSNLVANTTHFTKREFFELTDPAARQSPQVSP
jgi:LemA protein